MQSCNLSMIGSAGNSYQFVAIHIHVSTFIAYLFQQFLSSYLSTPYLIPAQKYCIKVFLHNRLQDILFCYFITEMSGLTKLS